MIERERERKNINNERERERENQPCKVELFDATKCVNFSPMYVPRVRPIRISPPSASDRKQAD